MIRYWDSLPDDLRLPEIKPYWDILYKKRGQILIKRLFDFLLSFILLLFLALPMVIIAILIKFDSKGPVFYRQERVTTYGKHFRIHKFRTMVINADQIGSSVTVDNDNRITKIGAKLRKTRLDELPQVFDVIVGNMSFVGTRPEAVKYVEKYTSEYKATLLLPAGITSETSIMYKDEENLINSADDVDSVYLQRVLPEKMKINLDTLVRFSLLNDFRTMLKTVAVILKR